MMRYILSTVAALTTLLRATEPKQQISNRRRLIKDDFQTPNSVNGDHNDVLTRHSEDFDNIEGTSLPEYPWAPPRSKLGNKSL